VLFTFTIFTNYNTPPWANEWISHSHLASKILKAPCKQSLGTISKQSQSKLTPITSLLQISPWLSASLSQCVLFCKAEQDYGIWWWLIFSTVSWGHHALSSTHSIWPSSTISNRNLVLCTPLSNYSMYLTPPCY
jgi:hypothetical protein